MSLQVWLPLNGDLHNQGLNPLSIVQVQSGVSLDNTGKIGKCYTNSGSSVNIATPCTFSAKTFSVCAWVKLNTRRNNWCRAFGMSGNGTYFGFGCEHTNGNGLGFHYYKTIDGTNTSIFDSYPVNISTGSWNHFVMCYDGIKYYIYQNGKLIKSDNANRSNIDCNMTTLYLFGGTANQYSQCSLNDIRIYDHVLSAKEVEEIAKGLVLHYKLDNITQPNLLSGNPNLINAWVQDGITLTQENDNSLKCVVTANTKRIYNNVSNVWTTVGNTYTVSFLAKAQTNGIEIRASRSIADYAPTFTLITDWKYYSAQITITATSTGGTLSIQGINNGDIFWLRDIKLENGNIATHYLLPNDIMNTIYDSSGYNNNGTIIGSLQTITPSPRYSCATKIANGQYIRVDNRPNVCMPKDAITVNLWQYATSWANPISCTEGGGWNFENSSGIRFPVYISGVGYKVAQSSITPASTQNAWHMLTGTMDKDNIKIYYDGEEVGTVANGSTNGIGYANNYIFIGAEASGDNTSPANSSYAGNLSDIRIYATALTPEQIKELYNTSMTIDNNGNIHARELVE